MFKKILFPVDFSPRCDAVAAYAKAYAKDGEAEVFLLHVLDIPDYLFGVPEYPVLAPIEIRNAQREAAHKKLVSYLANELEGIPVHRMLMEGDAAHETVKLADERKVDLIMLPTHGLGMFRRFILGSTAAKILHDAHCPVWTAAHTEALVPPSSGGAMHKIVCGVDLGPMSDTVLAYADTLAKRERAELVLVHALPVIEVRPASYFDVDFAAHLAAEAKSKMDALQAKFGTNYHVDIRGGEAADVLHDAALAHKADLIVAGRGHVTEGLGRLRTHSYAVINKSPCPVLSV